MKYIASAIKRSDHKRYEYIYWCIDLHSTIITPTYELYDKESLFYPWAIEVLQNLSANEKMKLILWTSSYSDAYENFLERVDNYSICFDFVNDNPDCKSTGLCDFYNKFYFDILLDNKAGFNAKKDWGRIKKTLERISEWK